MKKIQLLLLILVCSFNMCGCSFPFGNDDSEEDYGSSSDTVVETIDQPTDITEPSDDDTESSVDYSAYMGKWYIFTDFEDASDSSGQIVFTPDNKKNISITVKKFSGDIALDELTSLKFVSEHTAVGEGISDDVKCQFSFKTDSETDEDYCEINIVDAATKDPVTDSLYLFRTSTRNTKKEPAEPVIEVVPTSPEDERNNSSSHFTRPDFPVIPQKEPVKESTYSIHKSDSTWQSANNSALNNGGHLVYVNSASELTRICQMAESHKMVAFWVGAKRYYSENWSTATWQDGTPIKYSRWLTNEPSYYSENGESEEYLLVFKVKGVWYYNDAVNDISDVYSGKMGYIIEYEE